MLWVISLSALSGLTLAKLNRSVYTAIMMSALTSLGLLGAWLIRLIDGAMLLEIAVLCVVVCQAGYLAGSGLRAIRR